MRNSIILAGFAVIASISFNACTKSEVDLQTPEVLTHTVTINAAYAPETRTSIIEGTNSASFIWSDDDASRFVVKENAVKGTDVKLTLSNNNKTATISAIFETEAAETYIYSAYLAKNKTNSGNPKIPATQIPTVSSYDPDADILVAKSLSFNETQDNLSMQFARPVVINKMTLKGLTAGETISTVLISADQNIVGSYALDSQNWTGQGKDITVNVNQTVNSTGDLVVYFVSMPVDDVNLNITATSANYTFTKAFTKTISFKENQVTVFGVSGLTRTGKEDYSGVYVLANNGATYIANSYGTETNIPSVQSSLENSIVYYDPDKISISGAQVTLSLVNSGNYNGMYTIVQNGKYLNAAGAKSGDNYLKALSLEEGESLPASAYWEVSCNDGAWSIVATKVDAGISNIMQMNSSSKYFSCYASASQTAVALYKINNVKPTPIITAENISIEADAVSSTNTGATFNTNTSAVSAAAFDDEELTTTSTWLSVSVNNGDVKTVNYAAEANNSGAERTGYIKITAQNSDNHSVNKTIKVVQVAEGQVYETWTLVDKVENLTAGDYIMCAVVNNVYYAWTGKFSNNNCVTEAIEYTEHNELKYENATIVTLISKGTNEYYVKWISNGYTDYLTSSSNQKLKYSTTQDEYWTVSDVKTGVTLYGSVNSGYVRSATGASSNYIRSYGTTGNVGVVFFKKD